MNAELPFSIGEVSRRTGLTERALRLYEEAGLVSPPRTAGGRRYYRPADLARLQQVQVLRRTGYSLEKIGTIMRARSLDTGTVIKMHFETLKNERENLDRLIKVLEAAHARTEDGYTVDAATLCDLIRLAERSIEEAGWQAVAERYWTVAERERWKDATEHLFTDRYQQEWTDLIARVQRAIDKGLSPDSKGAIKLAKEWLDLQRPIATATPDLWERGARMFQEMEEWSSLVKPHFSKTVYDFVVRSTQAGRERGAIPPAPAFSK